MNDDIPRVVTGPVEYVWIEVYKMSFHEETTTPERGIGIREWPVLSELPAEIKAAKTDPMRKSSVLMRRSRWDRINRVSADDLGVTNDGLAIHGAAD